tara:strand:- start:52 stop:324 length:273 start_codon:yes stop_codon:yes gene_type:complete
MKVKDCINKLKELSPDEEIIMGVFTYQDLIKREGWLERFPLQSEHWPVLVEAKEQECFLFEEVWESLVYRIGYLQEEGKLPSDLKKEEAR